MMDLRNTQLALQRHLLDGDPAILAAIRGSGVLPASDRLAVYSHAYVARLVEALQGNYPATSHVLGEAQFEELARNYIRAHPSCFASVRHFGRELAGFVADRGSDDADAVLADLVRWEWALGCAFDGPDADSLRVEDLARIPTEHWPWLRFRFPGSLQRVALRSNAVEWWRFAVQHEPRPQAALQLAATDWVIWRTGMTTSFRSAPPDEARMLDAALRGIPFQDLCARMADRGDAPDAAHRAASLLRGWVESGWVDGIELST